MSLGVKTSVASLGLGGLGLGIVVVPGMAGADESADPEAFDKRQEIVSAIDDLGRSQDVSRSVERVVGESTTGETLTPPEYSRVGIWQAELSEADSQFDVVLIRNEPTDLASVRADCDQYISEWGFETCEASEDDGTVVRYVVRDAQRVPGGWPIVTEEGLNALEGDLYRLHQVVVYHPDGSTVQTTEVVQAASDVPWPSSRTELTRFSLDDRLKGAVPK